MQGLVAGIDETIRCTNLKVRLGLSDEMHVERLFLDGVARAEGHGAGAQQEQQGRQCDSRQEAEAASHSQDGKILAGREGPVKDGRGFRWTIQWGLRPWMRTNAVLPAARRFAATICSAWASVVPRLT